MSQATRNLWASFAATYPQPSKRDPNVFLSGYQLFIKRNSYCFLNHGIHSGFMLEPEFIEIQEQAVTAEIRQGEATIDCTELFIRNFGLLPKIDDWLLCKIIPIAENSGQFFAHIYQVLQVQEVFIDGLFVTLNIPDELEGVTFSVYLSKVNNQSVRYTGTKVRYMGCFTKKKFIELTDTPNSYNGQAGKIVVVNEEENAVEFIEYLPQNINVVNDYTTLVNVVNNFTVFDINTQMFYTYVNNEWVNITLNLNLIKVVQDYTTLVNVVNNTIVFDLTTNNFFRYDVDVWVQVGGGGGGLTCEDLLECPVIIEILYKLESLEDWVLDAGNSSLPEIKLGLFYNFWCVTDARKISSSDDWVILTRQQWIDWVRDVDSNSTVGGWCKSTGFEFWDSPNSGATNQLKLNFRGAGFRSGSDGSFGDLHKKLTLRNERSDNNTVGVSYSSSYFFYSQGYSDGDKAGLSIRLARLSSPNPAGVIGKYVGNDGKVYRTVTHQGIELMADNLAETKFRNGDLIPEVTDNIAWSSMSSAAMSAYKNDWSNV